MLTYTEPRHLRTRRTREEQRAWRSAVARSFRHGAAAELSSVPSAARAAVGLFAATDPAEGPRFGDLPVAVVSSAAYGPRWEAWQAELAAGSRWRVHTCTGDRSHSVHLRHPDLVADALLQVRAEVQARG